MNAELSELLQKTKELLKECCLCMHRCKIDRFSAKGFCNVDLKPRIFGAFLHYGEESILVPSATIFFSGCTMRCVYCQNAPESIFPELGKEYSIKRITDWILEKSLEGCKNVNFVGGEPTPYLYNILQVLALCKKRKIAVPVVWNSNSFYSANIHPILEDIVDLFLLDFRYFNDSCASTLSSVKNYVKAAKANILHADKLAQQCKASLLIRILVLPSHLECCTIPMLKWIAENCKSYAVNLMDQYWPAYKAKEFKGIDRPLSMEEYNKAKAAAEKFGVNLV